ncbi:stage V sporulation protein S [Paenibacillus barcinonensis]|uniref:Stage V sporulation protein S n=1 Tax=Paenibacillus barcinonensis TaxID=198119 RepID=A0A2V4VWC2_PAEBA|nr:stage V sporulation protein S [Paenibacillus barcinonensis]PYE49348.1 stage V sporulation protein S [Paenibacillus barcinonensis]QKS55559.1 stage V sporulation protein S [Paenibacillus barcinonensis]
MSIIHVSQGKKVVSERKILKVSAKSKVSFLAGAIASSVNTKDRTVEMHVIGAGAVNQAVKAIAVARGLVAPNGQSLICAPSFFDIVIDGQERTAMKLIVESVG